MADFITFQPKDHFKAGYYSGTGSELAITGNDHQPDFLWIKQANGTDAHVLFDAIRGATKYVSSSSTGAEATNAQTVKSFDSDGFTLGTDGAVNDSTKSYVSLSWKGNGQGSANSDGTITTTYTSANTTAGISIIQYTGNSTSGATIGHGLGTTPTFFMCKKTNSAGDNWIAYHNYLGATKYMVLNATDAAATASGAWNDTEPTSSVISLGNGTTVNGNTDTFICYAFAEKRGFSKFGSYYGNGTSGNGQFIYTGFKPGFIMIKRHNSTGNWNMYNMALNTTNKSQFFHHEANANSTWVDNTDELEVFSNGFRPIGSTKTDSNVNNGQYLYMAFAEEPIVSSNDVPTVAR